jgi:uncharacterized protein (DUF1501 family)
MNWCDEYAMISRRALFGSVSSAVFGATALSQIVLNKKGSNHTLVVVFLRGGMDGLSAAAPFGEDAYYQSRPTLALRKTDLQNLDEFFGLHPALSKLFPSFAEGRLAIVHAAGSQDSSHSHFEAMNAMERGVATAEESTGNGWLARYLNATRSNRDSALRAVAFSPVMPDSLRGGTNCVAIESLSDYRLRNEQMKPHLASMYANGTDLMTRSGRESLRVLQMLEQSRIAAYQPENGAVYPDSDFAHALKQVAFLVKNEFGVEIACLERGGWDTHVAQGTTSGWLASQLSDLGDSLAAFDRDIARIRRRVTVVVMTEFGRRAYENSGLGTDHGSASLMFLMGEGLHGGKVHGEWPGLSEEKLSGPGDLKVTTDYRAVLRTILQVRMRGQAAAAKVFPTAPPLSFQLFDGS